jgi:hypothetical protein
VVERGVAESLLLAEVGGDRPQTTFEDIEVGDQLGSIDVRFTREGVEGLISSDDEHDAWYEALSEGGGGIIPCLATYPPVRALFGQRFHIRGYMTGYTGEFLRPIEHGAVLTISGRIIRKWIKRQRAYVQYEAEGIDGDGVVYFRTTRTHTLDYLAEPLDSEATS